MSESKRIVIVGGVAGGASCAARARRLSESAEIVLYERGGDISFANCGMPYYIGGVIAERKRLLVQSVEGMRRRFRIDVRPRHEVLGIDREKREVRVRNLETGEEFADHYDELVLSPGAEPVRPPIPGTDLPHVLTLRNLADMDRIRARIEGESPRHALVVGGGYIGLEMTEALRQRKLDVTLVELAPQVFIAADPEMVAPIHQQLKLHGVDLRLNTSITLIREAGSPEWEARSSKLEAGSSELEARRKEETANGKGASAADASSAAASALPPASGLQPPACRLEAVLSSGETIDTDFVILAVGVKPESKLAREAGLKIGPTGGIAVDAHMRTSDPHIHAVGDAVEVEHLVSGNPSLIPLAGPANRQGRIAADNIFGRDSVYKGSQGTAICKVFELAIGMTGLSEKQCVKDGRAFEKVFVHPASHAGYYPGAAQMSLKLVFDPTDGKVLGAQAVGAQGVDKRIDVLATAIRANMTVWDLRDLELSYAPPFGSAKDPVNFAGFVASNVLDGDVALCHVVDVQDPKAGQVLLDVRTQAEVEAGTIPGAKHIPVDELRTRLDELPCDKEVLVFCQVGLRGYLACRTLKQHGLQCRNLTGGYKTWKAATATNPKEELVSRHITDDTGATAEAGSLKPEAGRTEAEAGSAKLEARRTEETAGNDKTPPAGGASASPASSTSSASPAVPPASGLQPPASNASRLRPPASPVKEIDARPLQCPGPIMRLKEELQTVNVGDAVAILAADPGFPADVKGWCHSTGNRLVEVKPVDGHYRATVVRAETSPEPVEAVRCAEAKGKTIVVFSGDFDKAMAAFIIANGAAAMGSKVTMFFTFWGLNVLRREQKVPVRKNLIERMFGWMMPRGADLLKLSKMNMGGMGLRMIKGIMRKKNVSSLAELIESARAAGVRLVACSMSMDLMGIHREELLDGIEEGGVATYLDTAESGNVNLFV